MAALLALSSSLMWGTADFLGGLTSRRIPALAVYGLSQAVGFVVLVLAATITSSWGADPGFWPWAIASSLLGMVGMLAFYAALSIGPMGIVSPLVALSVLVPVSFGLLKGEIPAGAADPRDPRRGRRHPAGQRTRAVRRGVGQATDPRWRRRSRVRRHVPDDGRGQRLLALMTMTGMRVTTVVHVRSSSWRRSAASAARRDATRCRWRPSACSTPQPTWPSGWRRRWGCWRQRPCWARSTRS